MAESSSVCSSSSGQSEIDSLRETLRSQQKLLQKLYNELEEEREASSSAASEALSMILRLQEEKAAEKMEATQYKRMAEEKMHHIERSLLFVKELMYHKEMEIAGLEFQVKAYRYKMLSMGFSDLVIAEMRFGEHRYLQQNEVRFGGDSEFHLESVRRNKSLPTNTFIDSSSYKANIEIEESQIPLEDFYSKKNDGHQEVEIRTEEINTYWEQIKHLDERINDLSQNQGHRSTISVYSASLETRSRSCSLEPLVNKDYFNSESRAFSSQSLDDGSVLYHETEDNRYLPDSVGVHDVFEVPQNLKVHKIRKSNTKEEKRLILKEETRTASISKETSDYQFKQEIEPVNKAIICPIPKSKSSKPRENTSIVRRNSGGIDPEIGLAHAQAEVQQLNKRMEQLEGQRKLYNHDAFDKRNDELRLLKEISEKLDMVQSEIISIKAKISHSQPRHEPSLASLAEAMLSFSI